MVAKEDTSLCDPMFASGKKPTQANGDPYPCTIGPDSACAIISDEAYQVTAQLSNGTELTSSSNQGITIAEVTTTPTPSATKPTSVVTVAAMPVQIVVSDSFSRTDSSDLGKADTGQAWVVSRGSFGISSGQAYPVDGCPAPGYAVIDAGINDATIEISLPINPQDTRIPFRFIDSNNTYWIETLGGTPGRYQITKTKGGVRYILKRSTITAANGDTLKIVLNGSGISLYVNNALAADTNDSGLNGTKYGIGTWCTGAVRFDNFSVTANPSTASISNNTSYDMKVLVLKYFPLTAACITLPNSKHQGIY